MSGLAKAMYILAPDVLEFVYPRDLQAQIADLVEVVGAHSRESVAADPTLLRDVEILLSGWGAPVTDQSFLDAAPRLRAVFYAAGSIRSFVTRALWDRNIVITTAAAANTRPVAEYVVGVILLSLKHFWALSRFAREGGDWFDPVRHRVPGTYRSVVGFISMSRIARRTLHLLEPFDLLRLAHCPYLSQQEANQLKVDAVSMAEVFRRAEVVSLHTPDLPETKGWITGELLTSMKPGATFINSARGAVVREDEMIEVLRARPDLTAVLDVTDPEPPAKNSPLLSLPNVVLTPHIAGSLGPECARMGQYMVDELRRYLRGERLLYQVSQSAAETLA